MRLITLIFAVAAFVLFAHTATAGSKHESEYAGQETRQIKSLSEADIAELERGGGWGLAKAAELNGVPGPAHLLELKDEIPLTTEQVAAITTLFEKMRTRATEQGATLIELERQLDVHFRMRTITDDDLVSLLQRIGAARAELRYIHLATHLETPQILTEEQIDRYNALRGYAVSDPCDAVPAGHNAAMWRKHNGCE